MNKIKVGNFVSHCRSKEIYKVIECSSHSASLIDAENRHYGVYPYNELRIVRNVRLVKRWERV